MKKIILAALVLPLLFVQCKKNEEDANQSLQKISKIHTQYEGGEKQLTEEWTWSGDNLSKITYPVMGFSLNFKYDKKNHVTEVNSFESTERILFIYDGNNLKKIEIFNDTALLIYIDCESENGKIQKMTINVSGDLDIELFSNAKTTKMMSLVIPNENMKILKASAKQNAGQKAMPMPTISTYYTWTKDNMTSAEAKMEYLGISMNISKATYKYDSKNNPFQNFTAGIIIGGMGRANPSKNNCTYIKSEMNEQLPALIGDDFPGGDFLGLGSYEINYTFKYNKENYPVEILAKDDSDSNYTTFYEYK